MIGQIALKQSPRHSVHPGAALVLSHLLVSLPNHHFGDWLRLCLIIVYHPVAGCRLLIETQTCRSLRSAAVTAASTLLRSGLPPLPHHNLWWLLPLLRFYSATMTSLVPMYRLSCIPANLTPGAVQPIIRCSLYFVSDANVPIRFSLRFALSGLHHWFTLVQLCKTQLQGSLPSLLNLSLTTTSFPLQQHRPF